MYSIFADGNLIYSPVVAQQGYAVQDPVLNMEVNKAGSLEFTVPVTNPSYNSYQKLKTIITIEKDGEVYWRGRVLNDQKDTYLNKSVFCEGELAFLNDGCIRPYSFVSTAGTSSGSSSGIDMATVEQVANEVINGDWGDGGERYAALTNAGYNYDMIQAYVNHILLGTPFNPADWGIGIDIPPSPGTPAESPCKQYLNYILGEYCNWATTERKIFAGNVVGFDNVPTISITNESFSDPLTELTNNLVEVYGGYFKLRHSNGQTYLDYYNSIDTVCEQEITFGINLVEYSDYVDASEIFTLLIPLGATLENGDRVTITSVNNGNDYISSQTGISLFGVIIQGVEFSEITDPATLLTYATQYLESAIAEATTITISAIDLTLLGVATEAIDVGMYIVVNAPVYQLDTIFMCSSITLNLADPSQNVYTLGSQLTTLSGQQASTSSKMASSSSGSAGSVETSVSKLLFLNAEGWAGTMTLVDSVELFSFVEIALISGSQRWTQRAFTGNKITAQVPVNWSSTGTIVAFNGTQASLTNAGSIKVERIYGWY